MKPIAVAAAGLAVAHAFVVVPDISLIDKDLFNALPVEAPFTADHQSLPLACPGCPLLRPGKAGKAGKKHPGADVANHLDLDFTVDHQPAGDRLLLNGFELYPNADPWHGALTAPQVADVSTKHHHPVHKPAAHDVQLGYSLAVRPMPKEDAAQQLQLIDVELQIIEIGNYFVDGVPTVKVGLLKSPGGELMIARVDTAAPAAVPDRAGDCETLVCRWKAMVHDRLEALKKFKKHRCGGRKKGQQQQQQDNATEQGTGDYRVIYRHRTWAQLLRNITTYIILPVLIGIVAGVSISM